MTHPQNCPCSDCMAACDTMAAAGLIPLNAEWWKTQTVFPVKESPAAPASRSERCFRCDGTGLQIISRPTNLYKCGFVHVAITCPTCFGFGRTVNASSPAVIDLKTMAAGGIQ